jgi:hypothetical protein
MTGGWNRDGVGQEDISLQCQTRELSTKNFRERSNMTSCAQ